ncbi:MAG: TIR domain-containing protein [Pirellulaceae bacterium]|nr:TIR domain-containing protein [Pirellulaceae bacterium]
MKAKQFRHDLAISFASQQRPLAQELANRLTSRGYSVFFDEYSTSEISGTELGCYFGDIFESDARFGMILASQDYRKRMWTNHEREFMISRRVRDNGYLLVVRCDNARIQGLPKSLGYWSANESTPFELVSLISTRIGKAAGTLCRDRKHISSKVQKEGREAFVNATKKSLQKAILVHPMVAKAKASHLVQVEMMLYHLEQEVAWTSRAFSTSMSDSNFASALGYYLADQTRVLRQKMEQIANAPNPPNILAITQYKRIVSGK